MGVIGCGWITKEYNLLVKAARNTKIVAAMDLDIKKAIKIGGKTHAYTDLEKMYKNEDIDVVYIATPHSLHRPMIKQAFEEGKHIFCEKPVGISVEDAREINELDKKYSNLKLGFNYNYRYDHNCFRLASGIQNEHIGKVFYANCNIFFSRTSDYFNQGPWRTKIASAGGGTLLIHGSHLIDVMLWAMGEPTSVIGKIDTMKFGDIEVEDVGFGIVEFESGAYAQINDSMIVHPRMRKLNDTVELHIFGEKGRCYFFGPWPFSSLKWKGIKKYKIKKNTKGIAHFGRSIKAFSNWIIDDIPFFNTIEESSRVLRMLSALYNSSKSGKKEQVESL